MIQEVDYTKYLDITHQRLSNGGVFLTVKGPKPNTMTIGWGGITYFWARPVFVVPVRHSRFTHGLIEAAGEFTVSVPLEADLKKALAYCGSKSGRDVDKFAECGLTAVPGQKITTPIIGQCELHFECRTVYKKDMDPQALDQKIDQRFYPDYHTMYFGEIINCYRTK